MPAERVIGELAGMGYVSNGVEILNLLKSRLNSAKYRRIVGNSLLVAEIQELKADPTVRAIGTIIKPCLDKGKSAVATFLSTRYLSVKTQSLSDTFGRVRAMTNDLESSCQVRIQAHQRRFLSTGLNEAPMSDHLPFTNENLRVRPVKSIANVPS